MTDEFERHACDFKGPEECEEELDDKGLDWDHVEKGHYQKDEESLEDFAEILEEE